MFLLTLSFLSFFHSSLISFHTTYGEGRCDIEGWRWRGCKTSTVQTEIQRLCVYLRVFTFDIRWTLNRVWVCDLCRVHGTREVLTFVILSLAALVSDQHRPDKWDIFTYPSVTAACQSLQLFRLLLQRCPLADSNSCMSLLVSIVLHWSEPHGGGGVSKVTTSVTFMVQGHAVIELHCHHNLVYSLSNAHGDNLAQVGWFTRMYLLILWHFWTNISDSSVGTVNWTWHLHESRGSRTLSHC